MASSDHVIPAAIESVVQRRTRHHIHLLLLHRGPRNGGLFPRGSFTTPWRLHGAPSETNE